jgi:hypothetical protein
MHVASVATVPAAAPAYEYVVMEPRIAAIIDAPAADISDATG